MRTKKWDLYLGALQEDESLCGYDHTPENMRFITKLIPPDTFPALLDIGCGNGLEAKILKDFGYQVTGLIRGDANWKYAFDNFPDVCFIEGDFHDLYIKSGLFNAVYMNHVFEHSYAPFIFLLELNCILTDGGRIWIGGPEFNELDDPRGELNRQRYHHHPNVICYNSLKTMFDSAGFKILYNTPIKNNPYFDNPYLLEKKPFDQLHPDVQKAILKRKEVFS